jgi:hypothetical protein
MISKKNIQEIFKNEINEVNIKDNETTNIFTILGCSKDELKNSRFIRWLLNNDAFFKYFVGGVSLVFVKIGQLLLNT